MTLPMDKGNALEFAVRAIETTILQSSPNLRENTFTIESKKRITVGGVNHEIDVYVEVDLGKGYKAIFIFECKNWEEAVGKNEIIIFSEKIDAVQAQQGFFVAKSITRYADAQAAKDPRITLLTATEHNADETPVPFNFHYVLLDEKNAEIEMYERGVSSSPRREPFQVDEARAVLKGADLNFDEYIREWTSEICNESMQTLPSGTLDEGDYEREARAERVFDQGELTVNDMDIACVELRVKFIARVIRPPVISHFEVATRGRSLSLAPVTLGDGQIQFGFVVK